ncbi:MAG: TIR domain-containing protein [bacterium]
MGLFSKKKSVIATIDRIWNQPPPGAPWYYWVYVLFESHGNRIKIHLKKRQAKHFVEKYSEGDTGYLEYVGDRMISWQIASAETPIHKDTGIGVFLSYPHEWAEDADYIAQVFQTHGLKVWLDVERLRVGDKLSKEIMHTIKSIDFFVPLLSSEYFASPWCIKEFELAVNEGVSILPVKVSSGPLKFPPHLQQLYDVKLGEPVYLDIRGKDPSTKLKELANQMIDKSSSL